MRAAVHANMAHGTSIRIEKRQFRPGAGGNNRRSQPSNPLHSSDRECWDQLRGTARHYSRRLQQLVLGRLTLIWAAFFWSPRDLFAPPHPTLLRRTQWVKAVHQLLEFGLLFFRKRLSCFHSLRRNSSQRARAAFTGLHAKAALPYKCISEVENGQYDCFWRPVGRLRHDAKLGRLRVALRPQTRSRARRSQHGRSPAPSPNVSCAFPILTQPCLIARVATKRDCGARQCKRFGPSRRCDSRRLPSGSDCATGSRPSPGIGRGRSRLTHGLASSAAMTRVASAVVHCVNQRNHASDSLRAGDVGPTPTPRPKFTGVSK